MSPQSLITLVMRHADKEGREHLPWRKHRNAYAILVSEYMLQQTQVDRVIPKYQAFMRAFPTVQSLAKAPLSQVLTYWQGLGYNRRGKFLHDAAKMIVREYHGQVPRDNVSLLRLPGIGPYTAAAVLAFAYDSPAVVLETNIRTALMHHLLPDAQKVPDALLLPYLTKLLVITKKKGITPHVWYGALMDYGANLKRQGVRINSKSAHYSKQGKFEGSTRQLRGAILRELLQNKRSNAALAKRLSRSREEIHVELERMEKEGMIRRRDNRFSVVA